MLFFTVMLINKYWKNGFMFFFYTDNNQMILEQKSAD